jgi:hypothetical protein
MGAAMGALPCLILGCKPELWPVHLARLGRKQAVVWPIGVVALHPFPICLFKSNSIHFKLSKIVGNSDKSGKYETTSIS